MNNRRIIGSIYKKLAKDEIARRKNLLVFSKKNSKMSSLLISEIKSAVERLKQAKSSSELYYILKSFPKNISIPAFFVLRGPKNLGPSMAFAWELDVSQKRIQNYLDFAFGKKKALAIIKKSGYA